MKNRPDPVPDDGVIQIALRLHGSMPAGVATGPGGAARDFTGWMGLMSAVDALAGAGESGEAPTEDEQR